MGRVTPEPYKKRSEMSVGQDCIGCGVKKQLELDGLVGTCNVMVISQIMESILSVHHGSVEIKIQDSKVIQIDTLEKKRLKEN